MFLTGVATTAGVEATAREAYDRGFNVVIVEDAMSDMSADNHQHAINAVYPRICRSHNHRRRAGKAKIVKETP